MQKISCGWSCSQLCMRINELPEEAACGAAGACTGGLCAGASSCISKSAAAGAAGAAVPDVLGCVAAAGAGRQAVSVYHAGPAVKHGQSVHRRLVSGSIALLALPPFAAGCPADDPTAQRVHHACTALEQVPSYLSAGDTGARLLPSTCSTDQAQQHTSCHKHAQPSSTLGLSSSGRCSPCAGLAVAAALAAALCRVRCPLLAPPPSPNSDCASSSFWEGTWSAVAAAAAATV